MEARASSRRRLSMGVAAAALLSGCASTASMQSARPLGWEVVEVGLEGSHGGSWRSATPRPLDRRIWPFTHYQVSDNAFGLDVSGRRGLGDRTDGLVRFGTGGLEGGLKRTFSGDGASTFAWAGMVTASARMDLATELAGTLLFEARAADWQSFVLAPRLHLTTTALSPWGETPVSPATAYSYGGVAPALSLTSITRVSARVAIGVELTGRHRGYPLRGDMSWPFWATASLGLLVRQ